MNYVNKPEARLNYKRRMEPECYRMHLSLFDNQYGNEAIYSLSSQM